MAGHKRKPKPGGTRSALSGAENTKTKLYRFFRYQIEELHRLTFLHQYFPHLKPDDPADARKAWIEVARVLGRCGKTGERWSPDKPSVDALATPKRGARPPLEALIEFIALEGREVPEFPHGRVAANKAIAAALNTLKKIEAGEDYDNQKLQYTDVQYLRFYVRAIASIPLSKLGDFCDSHKGEYLKFAYASGLSTDAIIRRMKNLHHTWAPLFDRLRKEMGYYQWVLRLFADDPATVDRPEVAASRSLVVNPTRKTTRQNLGRAPEDPGQVPNEGSHDR